MTALPEPGTVTLVGAGPGDPDLLTIGGQAALAAADVVIYDRLAPRESLTVCRPDCELVHVGKVPRGPYTPQERINELLITHARAGKRVVRFKGGDSFVFGRGGEEWQACANAGIEVRVIPGVTSAVAVPAMAGIPVTHRDLVQSFVVVSGHVAPDDERSSVRWAELARSGMTIVMLMGVAKLAAIAERLISEGRPAQDPVAIIADGSLPTQRVLRTTLAEAAAQATGADIQPPATVVIGKVVSLELQGNG